MASKKDPLVAAREVLAQNRGYAIGFLEQAGQKRTEELLADAARDLAERIVLAKGRGLEEDAYTVQQMRATLAQVQAVTKDLNKKLKAHLFDQAPLAGEAGAEAAAKYMTAADKAFRGTGTQPLALKTAAMLSEGRGGAKASILARIAGDPYHPAQEGVLQRYGVNVVGYFERELRKGVTARKSRAEMVDDLTSKSPFLQGSPRFWAERIVRTEVHHAINRGQWEATKKANEELGDVVKIVSSVFDDRTGADSYAVHGQIRLPEEAFESWYGLFQHPPDRPNDRGVVVPHRQAWPLPPYLAWVDDDVVAKHWEAEGHKEPMPERPLMTTVPLGRFGRG